MEEWPSFLIITVGFCAASTLVVVMAAVKRVKVAMIRVRRHQNGRLVWLPCLRDQSRVPMVNRQRVTIMIFN